MVGATWLLLGALYLPFVWLDLLWWAALIAAAIADMGLLRRADRVTASRSVSPVLSLGTDNRVELVLRNRSGQEFQVIARDEPPLDFDYGELRLHGRLPGSGEWRPGYDVTPRRRGDYSFGSLDVRLTSGLGLLGRQLRFDLAESVKVYPNLVAIRKYQLSARKERLRDIGVRSLRALSLGTEFESLRTYVSGDELRRIDWKATARRDEPITRQYDIERSQHVVVSVDLGRTMLSELGVLSKADHAVNAAALLCHVAARLGDWVGLYAFSARPLLFVPPRRNQFSLLLEYLYGLQAERVESDYSRCFLEAAGRIRKRALVVLLTDLIDPESSGRLLRHVGLLTRRHFVLCAALSDYELYELSTRSPERARELYERTVATELLADRQRAISALWDRGAVAFDATPENLSVAVVNRYLEAKARGRL